MGLILPNDPIFPRSCGLLNVGFCHRRKVLSILPVLALRFFWILFLHPPLQRSPSIGCRFYGYCSSLQGQAGGSRGGAGGPVWAEPVEWWKLAAGATSKLCPSGSGRNLTGKAEACVRESDRPGDKEKAKEVRMREGRPSVRIGYQGCPQQVIL